VLEAAAAFAKALLYGALLSAAGASLATASLRASAAIALYASRVVRTGALAVMALTIVAATLLFVRLGAAFDRPTLAAVFSSGSGAALALQLAGAALLLTPTVDDVSGALWRIPAALIMTASVVFNGHAAALSPLAGLVAMAHVAAAAWWVGALWLLRRACVTADDAEIVRLVMSFSSVAVRVIAGLIAAGVALIVVLLDWDRPLVRSGYVLALVMKLIFVALVLGVAAYNKSRLSARLPGEIDALRRNITVELGLIACVLLATAVLTTYFSPET
jgi:putative copper export protein